MKYPYPTNIITNYTKDYKRKGSDIFKNGACNYSKDEAFNLEKEHKIMNKQFGMDLKTTANIDFKPFKVVP